MSRISEFYGFQDKTFYRSVFKVCLPIAVQQTINFTLQLVDNIMVGSLGDTTIAAVALANQVSFVIMILNMGLCAAGTAFASQHWGRGDVPSIRRTLGLVLEGTGVMGILFFALSQLVPEFLLSIFSSDAAVIAEGTIYLKAVGYTFLLQPIILSVGSILRSMEELKIPTVTTVLGVATNCVFNYLMIFGKLGFPVMGVAGAAYATNIANIVNCTVLLLWTYKKKVPLVTDHSPLFRGMPGYPVRFLKRAIPILGNEALWAGAQTVLVLIYARLGTQMSAAMGIFNVLERIALLFFMALSNGCVVIVGKELGQEHLNTAFTYATRLRRLAISAAFIMGPLVNIIGPMILSLYNASELAKYIVVCNLFTLAIKLPFEAHNFMMAVGVLRAGGDTRFAFVMDSGAHWVLNVPFLLLGAFIIQAPLQWVFAFTLPADLIKMYLGWRRFYSRKWINVLR
ncbi:MAG: MATE family efflux transporter [Clostridiales bacterium]|nr:MATE family efflux transporter [Clostridiales bacterium]